MLFAAGGRGTLLVVPRPLSGCQIKADIKGFLLSYLLFQYKHWFCPNLNSNISQIRLLHPVEVLLIFLLMFDSHECSVPLYVMR